MQNINICNGNNFDAIWEDFCVNGNENCSTCVSYLTINDIFAYGLYEAENSVYSNGNIQNNGIVTVNAGNFILMDVGFEVSIYTDFEAVIDDCGN